VVALVVGASRRDQILAAVLEVVRSEGWTEVSMRRVADRTGITATALYRHFDDKEALIDAAVDVAVTVLMSRFALATLEASSGEGRLWASLEEIRRFAVEEPDLYAFIFFSVGPSGGAANVVPAQANDRLIDALEKQVAGWMSEGDMSGETAEVAAVIAAQAHGLVLLWRQGRFQDPEAFAGFYRRAFWIMLAGVGNQ
jgi:AcrR family transcriptional regulator